jgi:hypothetical protein
MKKNEVIQEQSAPVINTAERKKQRDLEMVRGKFMNIEAPGGKLFFSFRVPYRDQKVQKYEMVDGEIYTVPRAVARHLNTSGMYPEYSYITDEAGRPSIKMARQVRRYSFQSLEFWDEDTGPSPIIQASYV